MKEGYKIASVAVLYAALAMHCAPDKGHADMHVLNGANGARDTLVFHQQKTEITEKYLILKDTTAIIAGAHDVQLDEDNFNGGFFIGGSEKTGNDYFHAHYDIDSRNLNDVLAKTYIQGFTWNDDCCGRSIYLNYLPR